MPKLSAPRSSPSPTDTEVTVARNRHETRTVKVFRATQAVAATEWQSLIKLFVCVSRDVLQRSAKDGLWSSTSEVAYLCDQFPHVGSPRGFIHLAIYSEPPAIPQSTEHMLSPERALSYG
jgi:hypothetical protein